MTTFADIFANRPVLADGAMGTVLYARGVSINRCYDELNLSDPGLIESIHEEYLQAGAEIIETNTFGANRFRLARHGLAGKTAEINAAGVRLARQAVEHLKEKQASHAWVAGTVGPLGVRLEPLGKTGLDEARAAFAEQIQVLTRAGVDLLIVTEAGFGKRTKLDHFHAQARGGQGVRGIKLTQRRGWVVAALMASLDDDILIVASGGVVIRTAVREIAAQGRDATGVRVMNLDPGQTVAAVAQVSANDEE